MVCRVCIVGARDISIHRTRRPSRHDPDAPLLSRFLTFGCCTFIYLSELCLSTTSRLAHSSSSTLEQLYRIIKMLWQNVRSSRRSFVNKQACLSSACTILPQPISSSSMKRSSCLDRQAFEPSYPLLRLKALASYVGRFKGNSRLRQSRAVPRQWRPPREVERQD